MTDLFNSKDYIVSRGAYKAQCAFDYFISLMVTDAFLAKLLKSIGMSDALTGIVSSIISIMFLFQLISLTLIQRVKSVKRSTIILDTISQVSFALMFLVPFIPIGSTGQKVIVVILILLGYFFLYMNNNTAYKWGNSFVDPEKRGIYSAQKEMISLISGVAFTLFVGFVVDNYEEKGKLSSAFIFIAVAMGVVVFFNLTSLLLMKDAEVVDRTKVKKLKTLIKKNVGNKNFRNVIIMCSICEFARYLSCGFFGTFKTIELGYSLGTVQLINMVACLARFSCSIPFGKYSDKHGYAKGYLVSLIIAIIAFAFAAITGDSTKWGIIVFTILLNISFAGMGQNTYCFAYYYVESSHILDAMAVNSTIRGISGFVASLIGGRILNAVANNSNSLFGFKVYGQQVLSALSVLIFVICAIYCAKVVLNQQGQKK